MASVNANGQITFDDENNALGWGDKALMRQALGGQPIAYGTGFTTAQTALTPTIQSNIDYIKAANARYLQPQTTTTTTSATTTPVTNAGTFNWKGLLPWNWGKDTVVNPGVIDFDTIKIVDQLTPEQIQANFGKTTDEWNAMPLSERTSAFNQLRYQNALDKLDINPDGLDFRDIKYLKGIVENFKGGPVGIDALSQTIGEESSTIEDVYEPYLLQEGYIQRTPRGRIATEKTYKLLNKSYGGLL